AHRSLDARRGQEARVMRHDGLRAWAGVIGVAVLALVIPTPAPAREQVAAVLHVHSDLTTGDLPLDEVARIAESSGLSAIFLAENYLLRVEYGLPPFRALTRVTKEETSVLGGAGTTQFFERAIVVVWRRRWGLGLALLAVGLFAVVRGWPFTVDRYPPWQDAGLEPYQTLIDQVDRLGGASMWSFPETADVGQRHVGPVQV